MIALLPIARVRAPWWRRVRAWLRPHPSPVIVPPRSYITGETIGSLRHVLALTAPRRRYERPFAYRARAIPPERMTNAIELSGGLLGDFRPR